MKTGGRPKRSLRVLLVLCVVSVSCLVNSRHSSMFSFHNHSIFAVIARVVTSLASSVAFARLTRRRGCSIWWRTRVRVFAINISQSVAPPLFFITLIPTNPSLFLLCVYWISLRLAAHGPTQYAHRPQPGSRQPERVRTTTQRKTKGGATRKHKETNADGSTLGGQWHDWRFWMSATQFVTRHSKKKTRSCTDQFTHVLYGTPVQCERWVCRHSQFHSIGRSSLRPFVSSSLVVANFSCYRSDFILLKLHYKCYTTLTLCRSQASATSTQYITCAFSFTSAQLWLFLSSTLRLLHSPPIHFLFILDQTMAVWYFLTWHNCIFLFTCLFFTWKIHKHGVSFIDIVFRSQLLNWSYKWWHMSPFLNNSFETTCCWFKSKLWSVTLHWRSYIKVTQSSIW